MTNLQNNFLHYPSVGVYTVYVKKGGIMLNSEILALIKIAFVEETKNQCLFAKDVIAIKLANGTTKRIRLKNIR